tara:strand:- start:243 stop:626 length:384 start_codon:yes stop_codon:yes gene_type:complete
MNKLKPKIIKLRKNNPLMSNAEIAEKVGCSRQYIHRLLKKEDFPNPPRPKKIRLCEVCKKESTRKVHKGRCSYEYYKIELTCAFCRIKFKRDRSAVMQGYRKGFSDIYCSAECVQKGRKDKTLSWAT